MASGMPSSFKFTRAYLNDGRTSDFFAHVLISSTQIHRFSRTINEDDVACPLQHKLDPMRADSKVRTDLSVAPITLNFRV